MTTTFSGVELPGASKISEIYPTLTKETVLLSGKRSIQSNAYTGFGATYQCLGTKAQFDALLALVGTVGSLVTEYETHTNCYISGDIRKSESDAPGYFQFTLEFKQDTT